MLPRPSARPQNPSTACSSTSVEDVTPPQRNDEPHDSFWTLTDFSRFSNVGRSDDSVSDSRILNFPDFKRPLAYANMTKVLHTTRQSQSSRNVTMESPGANDTQADTAERESSRRRNRPKPSQRDDADDDDGHGTQPAVTASPIQ